MEHHLQVTQLEHCRVVLGAVFILPTNPRAVVGGAVIVTFAPGVRAMNPSDQEAQFIQHLLGT